MHLGISPIESLADYTIDLAVSMSSEAYNSSEPSIQTHRRYQFVCSSSQKIKSGCVQPVGTAEANPSGWNAFTYSCNRDDFTNTSMDEAKANV